MIQEEPGIVRDRFVSCQEQIIFTKNIFLYNYKCSYILTPLYSFQVKKNQTFSCNEALLRRSRFSGAELFGVTKNSTGLMRSDT